MVGDVPKNAPLRCRLGRHTGQERGGTMIFQCLRCGGSFWQPDRKRLRQAEIEAELLYKMGRGDEGLALAKRIVQEVAAENKRRWGRL